jgi:hypothetical protein
MPPEAKIEKGSPMFEHDSASGTRVMLLLGFRPRERDYWAFPRDETRSRALSSRNR